MTTVYSALLSAGCEIDSHESDLYVKNTPAAMAVLTSPEFSAVKRSRFLDSSGALWHEIPFAFEPFWLRAPLPVIKSGTCPYCGSAYGMLTGCAPRCADGAKVAALIHDAAELDEMELAGELVPPARFGVLGGGGE